ncbi:hypothetical protein ACIQU3_08150 [Streptomyces sp. NPDC101110]|uniref:hypothetical protein n=1 Tax=Streptomyces sp. NPDC101110 TaxID=3366104 RepID=UPI00380BA605
MSTEAQRASFPPRPATPPRPSHPPATPQAPAQDGRETAGTSSGTTTAPEAASAGTAAGTDGEKPSGRPNGHPRFPSLGATKPGDAAPRRTESAAPPPPRASTRFPDAPPSAGRASHPAPHTPSGSVGATRPEPSRPSTGGTGPEPSRPSTSPASDSAPPRPRHLPAPESSAGAPPEAAGRPFRLSAPGRPDASAGAHAESAGRPFRLPTPRRTGTPGERTSETTAGLLPADPAPDEPAAPSGRPAARTTTAAPHGSARPTTPPRPAHEPSVPAGTDPGTTAGRGLRVPPAPDRRPAPPRTPAPDPALSWSATRPLVSFGEPEGYDADARPRPLGRRTAPRAAAAAVCLVLGLGLISGAATGSWLVGDSGAEGSPGTFAAAGSLWHRVPVDQLFPPTVQGRGAGPGGADRTWTRIAVAPDTGCKDAFDPLLRKALAPAGCERLLRATYTDATESYVTTVGLLFTTADAPGMTALANRFRKERLDRRNDLMPLPYAAKGTPAADFGARQRASWTVSVLTEAPVVVYAVSGWADGRTVDDPQPASDAVEADTGTAAAQAGLGNEAQGLADRVERDFRKNVRSASEQPS